MPVDYSRTWSCCYIAAAVQAIAVNLAPLFFAMFSAQFAISFEKIGRLVLISFLAQLITDLIAVFFVDRFGYRTCLVTAHGAVALGLIAFGILPSVLEHAYVSMTVSAVIYSVGAGMLEVLISPLTQALPGTNKSASMSMVHSFYSWGQVAVILLTTVAVTVCGDKYWWVMFIVWALLPLYNLVCGLRAPLPPVIPREERASSVQLFKTPLFWLMMLLMMCGGAAEQVMAQWASLFAEKGLGVSKVVGDLLGPCLFAAFMGVGRLLYGRSKGNHLHTWLTGCAALCVVCYLITVFVPVPVVALLGCGACGLSVSLMWPGTLSLSATRFPNGSTALFACLALAGDAGCAIGPWLTGMVSDVVKTWPLAVDNGMTPEQFALRAGILAGAVFPAVMLVNLLFTNKRRKRL